MHPPISLIPLTSLLTSLLLSTTTSAQTVYLIRHGEKPSDDGDGLSVLGMQRAQCLRNIFGNGSVFDIGYIMAQTPKKNGKRSRPLATVQPLATDLNLIVDASCDRDDAKCVADVVNGYSGVGNILVCWEHDSLTGIVEALGDKNAPKYDDDAFDIIWTDPKPFTAITEMSSENCSGLDTGF
ncbi:hypothetical protein EYC80_000796 [Monilinia laxa]|uniref:Phosphoglycerate mutase family protein n=1 Tax=Monilinia laxa TaxID=61186 RepID=A0A5N6K786_MONLA|nr:hypothetical protein EYC80_000796 [Monilinia laxa]